VSRAGAQRGASEASSSVVQGNGTTVPATAARASVPVATITQDSQPVEGLLDSVLRAGRSIAAEYPTLFGSAASGSARAFATIEADGAVVSACALVRRDLVVRDVLLPVGLIGSVATLPEHRGRGFATAVLEAAEAELRRTGALLAILWADDAAYYAKRGYRPFGGEHDFVLPAAVAPDLPALPGVRARTPDDDEAIHELYAAHPERVERTLEETRVLLACPRMEVLVCERWGRLLGYACVGRGEDLAHAVHEWGGDAQTLLALARTFFEHRLERGEVRELVLMAPRSAVDLSARLREHGIGAVPGILGMAKLLEPRACAELVARRLDRRGQLEIAEDAANGGGFRFTNEYGEVACPSDELLDLLCTARGSTARADLVAHRLGLPPGRLPLEPFVWGLDSI
jgi:GNAT superfamily N-acetyltransferase